MGLALAAVAACSPGYTFPPLAEAGETTLHGVSGSMSGQTEQIYGFTLNDIDGKPVSLGQFRGKVMLVVNTASFCGNTPQYEELQAMYERRYRNRNPARMRRSRISATRSTV